MTIMKKETDVAVTLNVSGVKVCPWIRRHGDSILSMSDNTCLLSQMFKYAEVHAPFKTTCKADIVSWQSLTNKNTFLIVHL